MTSAHTGVNGTCLTINDHHTYRMKVQAHARNQTADGSDYDWEQSGLIYRDVGAGSTSVTMIGSPTVTTRGTTSGAAFAVTADTSLGCISVTFTPPTSNTSTWNAGVLFETFENGQ
jgi:acyl-coenzyme A thioesterase PaaI-like protein